MARFFGGLAVGGISAGITYGCTADGRLTVISAAVGCVLSWLIGPTLFFFLDD